MFLSIQILGTYAGFQYMQYIKSGEAIPIFENPEEISNSFFLIFYILIMTAVILLIIRFKVFLLSVIEAIAIFFTSAILFELLFPYAVGVISVGIILGFIITAWKVLRPSLTSQNIALVFSVSGAGAIIGASFGIIPVLVFILLLSIYDFISVFFTKHMVYMAKALTKKPMAFTAAFPTKTKKYQHIFQLGGGDLVIPLVLSVSVLNSFGFWSMIYCIAGSLTALLLLFSLVVKRPGRPLPALPPIAAGGAIGFVISLLI